MDLMDPMNLPSKLILVLEGIFWTGYPDVVIFFQKSKIINSELQHKYFLQKVKVWDQAKFF